MSPVNLVLLDDPYVRGHLQPFTLTRPVADIRIGILTIREKWQHYIKSKATFKTQDYLSVRFPMELEPTQDTLLINGSICPDPALVAQIIQLPMHSALYQGETFIACHLEGDEDLNIDIPNSRLDQTVYSGQITQVKHPWDIFQLNGQELESDFALLTKGRTSKLLPGTNMLIGPKEQLFIEETATVNGAMINTQTGPVYIGDNAEVMEGTMIRGGLALCQSAVLKMGAKVYGPTTIGPFSKVGGEVNNIVVFGYSNKGHDGFLGNSVIGAWCNLGADTNTSNLKNNYSNVKVWSYSDKGYIDSGVQFCGLMMGDHSKSSINVMFNTGTVVGVSSNIYGSGFPPKFIPSFSWGSPGSFVEYKSDKAFEVARKVMARRNVEFSEADQSVLNKVFEYSKQFR